MLRMGGARGGDEILMNDDGFVRLDQAVSLMGSFSSTGCVDGQRHSATVSVVSQLRF
jgi:hypothetical protein